MEVESGVIGPERFVLPDPADIPAREREDAMGAYLMMFASLALGLPLPFLGIVASIVYYAVNHRHSRFVAFHSLQALLAHVPVALANGLCIVWFVVALVLERGFWTPFWLALAVVFALNVVYLVVSILALRRAARGLFWYIPLIGPYAFDLSYGAKALAREARRAKAESNQPPPGYRP